MLMLNFFDTFGRQLKNFCNDAKSIFIDIINSIHRFLNRFFDDKFLFMLLIVIAAMIAILIFRAVINRE